MDGTEIWRLSENGAGGLPQSQDRLRLPVREPAADACALIDNVALPALLGAPAAAGEAYGKAAALLDQMGLARSLDAYPSEISAGEQRRAVIARALINDPAIAAGRRADVRSRRADRDARSWTSCWRSTASAARRLLLVTHNLAPRRAGRQIVHIANGAIVPHDPRSPDEKDALIRDLRRQLAAAQSELRLLKRRQAQDGPERALLDELREAARASRRRRRPRFP